MNKKTTIYAVLIVLIAGILGLAQTRVKTVEAFDFPGVPEENAVIKVDEETLVYKVGEGDTLWSISKHYRVDPELVAAMNGITTEDPIIVGQILSLPNEQWILHTVAEGETLWRIAYRYGLDVAEVARENGIEDITFVREGQTIIIPRPIYLEATSDEETYVKVAALGKPSGWGINLGWIWPTEGVISSLFGIREGEPHEGLDIANDMDKPVYATLDGEVIFAGPRGSYGNAVIIDHGNGYKTLYAHSSEVLVEAGDEVVKGQEIARIGSTGRSTGPHLHFEIIEEDLPRNPLDYLPGKKY